jgi:predicted transcriptional regulator
MEETSLMAYKEIEPTLGERQKEVYLAIKSLVETDNLLLSRYLRLPINSITPRVLELRKLGLVKKVRVGKSIVTNRNVNFWGLK